MVLLWSLTNPCEPIEMSYNRIISQIQGMEAVAPQKATSLNYTLDVSLIFLVYLFNFIIL